MIESILQNVKRTGLVLVALFMLLQTALPMTAFADGNDSPDECLETTANVIGSIGGEDNSQSGDLVTYNAGSNKTVTGVCIKSGDDAFGDKQHSGVLGNGTYEDGCYQVAGVGTQTVTVTRLIQSAECKEISHVDITYEEAQTPDTTVEVVKELLPSNDTGLFNLKVNGTTYASNVGDNGTTGEKIVDPEEDVTVTETAGTDTSLTDYTTYVSCINQNQEVIKSGSRDGAGSRTLTIDVDDIEPGDDITCTFTNTRVSDEINYCDPSQKPGGVSIAQWLRNNQVHGSECFEYEVTPECGSLDAVFTKNLTPYSYSFRYALGSDTPDVANWAGDGTLPVNFAEDENGGSVTLTYYIVGEEADYFSGFGMPNIWDGNGTTVVVDTDCQEPPTSNLRVVKYATNNNGGKVMAKDFTIKLNGNSLGTPDSHNNGYPGSSASYNNIELEPGVEYTLTENLPKGYANEYITCFDVTNGLNGAPIVNHPLTPVADRDYLCNIGNDDIAPKLTVTKYVKDNYKWNGNLTVSDFPLYVNFHGVQSGVANEFNAGLHVVWEVQQEGYEQVYIGDDCHYFLGVGLIDLEIGREYNCDIVNKAKPGSITLYKHVINDNGGHKDSDDFKLNIGFEGDVEHGERNYLPAGLHWIWETKTKGYDLKEIKCYDGYKKVNPYYTFNDGSIKVNLKLDQHLKCWLVNDDEAPKITVKKVTHPHYSNEEFDFKIDNQDQPDWQWWEDRYFDLKNGQSYTTDHKFKSGEVNISEDTPKGWTLTDIDCYVKKHWGFWQKMHNEGKFYAENGREYKCVFTNDKNGEITGEKFNDLNGNGIWEEGEPTMGGWTIELYKKVCSAAEYEQPEVSRLLRIENPKFGDWHNYDCEYELQETDVTDENGKYSFDNLKYGKYKVCEEQTQLSQGNGWTQTTPEDCYKVEVDRWDRYHKDLDFGNAEHRIEIVTAPACTSTFPYLNWTVTAHNFAPTEFTFDWFTNPGDQAVPAASSTVLTSDAGVTQVGNVYTGSLLWPGADTTLPDWPGWSFVNSQWVEDTNDFGGNLRPNATVQVSTDTTPTATTAVEYTSDKSCDPPQPAVLGTSTLANTGSSTIVAGILALSLIATAGSVTLLHRKNK